MASDRSPPPVESSEETRPGSESEEEMDLELPPTDAPKNMAEAKAEEEEDEEVKERDDEDEQEEEKDDEVEEEEETDGEVEEEEETDSEVDEEESETEDDEEEEEEETDGEVDEEEAYTEDDDVEFKEDVTGSTGNVTAPRDFDEMCKAYPYLAEEVRAIDREHPVLFRSAFCRMNDDEARALDREIKRVRMAEMELLLRELDTAKEVVQTIMDVMP